METKAKKWDVMIVICLAFDKLKKEEACSRSKNRAKNAT